MRSLAVGLLSGLVIVLFTTVFWRWSVGFSLVLAVTVAAMAVVTSAALRRDVHDEDEAWRLAAPDLVDPPAGPRDVAGP